MSAKDNLLPGDILGSTTQFLPGPGTHLYNTSQICASLAGPVTKSTSTASAPVKPNSKAASNTNAKPKLTSHTTVSVPTPPHNNTSSVLPTGNTLPEVDSVVLAKVTRLNPRQATVSILVVDDQTVRDEFQGVIRVQDVRATEKDKVKIGESFRVGDVVRAVVISLGDQQSYYLSTARNELGVVMARSEAGNGMYPVSWREFRDPKTGGTELRKVAKPF